MKENCQEVKKTLYAGMSIFNLIKDTDINIEKRIITEEDKKYLSLYLGIINTKNTMSDYLKDNNINIGRFINFRYLKQEEYLDIYNEYFVDVFNAINFNSLKDNLEYLLSKQIIKSFNSSNKYYIDILFKNINKSNEYVKQLRKIS